jgi:hypothetical protein
MRVNRWIGIAVGAALAALMITPGGTALARYVPEASAAPSYVTHLATGCGLPATVYTPSHPGATLPGVPSNLMARADAAHARWLPTITCKVASVQPDAADSGSATAPNWSGYYDKPSVYARVVQAYWHVPKAGPPSSPSALDDTSIWPGIGNPSTNNPKGPQLIQAGSSQDVKCKVSKGKCAKVIDSYYFWIEAFPAEPALEVTNLAVSPGQSVAAAVWWVKGTGATYALCNFSRKPTAECVYATQKVPGNNNTAEWIVERAAICSAGQYKYLPLGSFGKVAFTGAAFDKQYPPPDDHLRYSIAQGNPLAISMVQGKTTIAQVGKLSGDGRSFSVKWKGYGKLTRSGEKC